MQFQLGWSLLAVIVLNVLINVAILIQFMLRSCINKIRLKYMKKKHQKLVTKQMKRLSVVNAHRAILIDKLDSIKEEPEQEAKNTPRDNGINGSQEPQLL